MSALFLGVDQKSLEKERGGGRWRTCNSGKGADVFQCSSYKMVPTMST